MEQAVRALGACLAALALCGLLRLGLLVRGRRARAIEWSAIGWVAVMWACLAVVYVVGLYGARGHRFGVTPDPPDAFSMPTWWTCPAWGDYFAAIGVPLILLSVAAVVVLHRGRHPEARRVGPVRQYVATAVAVLLPVSALICLSAVGFTVAGAAAIHRQADVHRAVMEQGELRCYALTPEVPTIPGEPTTPRVDR
jgi:hypothetical protein